MFKFLKNKLKGAISKFSQKVDEEGSEDVIEQPVDVEKESPDESVKKKVEKAKKEPKVKPGPKKKVAKKTKEAVVAKRKEVSVIERPKVTKKEPMTKTAEPKVKAEIKKEIEESRAKSDDRKTAIEQPTVEVKVEKKAKKGFFSRLTEKITTKKITATQFDDLFWELEITLLENNVAVQVIEKIKEDLRTELVDKPIARTKIEETILSTLQHSVDQLFIIPDMDLLAQAKEKSPLVICFIGINGSGKTTTIAKMTKFFQDAGKSVVLAAADTFRAAAIDQLQIHADALKVKLIKHDYGADAAAVAFDAIEHARAKGKDIVLIDTAGRLHSNHNLVDEMKKIMRVAKPDVKIFVGESITGNDCIEQAVKFDEAVGIDGIILSKADIDEKGGAAVSVSYVTRKPILYLGTGQEYGDLEPFSKESIMAQLFS